MALKQRYVVYGAYRFTPGMWMMLIILSGIGGLMYLIYAGILTITPDDISWIIGFFVIMGLFSLFAFYFDKTRVWPYYILEVYDDGWMRYMVKYEDDKEFEHDFYLSPDLLIVLKSYKKKYSKRKNSWYINSMFGFIDGIDNNKVYGAFFYGWVVEPKDIKKYDELFEWIKRKSEENVKRVNIKVPSSVLWYPIDDWEKSEKAKKMKEMQEKIKKEAAEQVSQ